MGAATTRRQVRGLIFSGCCWLLTSLCLSGGRVSIESVCSSAGMVVAGHPEAAEIGASILEKGGNAMDAVVATGFALGVAEPYGSGIGGKCVILYYEASTGRIWFVDGLDESGTNIDVEAFVAAGSDARAEGAIGVGVPGMVATMDLAHRKWGHLPWESLLEPSIELARDGFKVVPGMGIFFERRIERMQSNPECARIYIPGGSVPVEGSRLANPDLAKTMEHISRDGRAGFYEGVVAGKIIKELKAGGSHLTLEDLRQYKARIWEPLSIDYGEYQIVTGGRPTSGGATTLLSLEILEGEEWPDPNQLRTSGNLDLWGSALRHVYPVIQANMADSDDVAGRWERISNPDAVQLLKESAFGNRIKQSAAAEAVLAMSGNSWTTHFVVADKYGNVASVTQSLSHHFGSGVVAPGTGVVLNNSLKNFSFSDPHGVNYVGAKKRPRSTIAPAIVFKDNQPVLAIGLPGGGRIPTTLSAILIDYLEFGSDLGESISAPRVHLLRSWSEEPDSNVFQMEAGTDPQLVRGLSAAGWETETVTDTEFFGGITAIEIGADGELTGWADTRRTNHAASAGGNSDE